MPQAAHTYPLRLIRPLALGCDAVSVSPSPDTRAILSHQPLSPHRHYGDGDFHFLFDDWLFVRPKYNYSGC